jgi:hypothetical protein
MFILESLDGSYAIDISGRYRKRDLQSRRSFLLKMMQKRGQSNAALEHHCCQLMNVIQMDGREE